jgi:hypothetical protein
MIPAGDRRQPSAGEAGHTGTSPCEPAVGIGHFGSSAIEISTNGNPTGGPTMSSPSNRGHCLEVGHRSPPLRSTNITSAGTNGGRGGSMSVAGPPLARPSQASTRPRRKPGHDGRDFRQRRTTEESGSGDPTRSASRHPGGTATGWPQTERESEPASSAVAANARVRRRPGTSRAATAPMITTPAPTCVRCGREIQCRSSCVSGTMPVSTARATRFRLEGLGARAAEEGT